MHFEQRHHYSSQLGREMYFNVYGHAGKPIIVFPSSGGSPHEYADFGMIDAARWFIDQGKIRFFCPDSIDKESWLAEGKSAHDKAQAHNAYDRYIISEFIPLVKFETGWYDAMGVTGCSMGAYHAVNFTLRHPDVFDMCIALSGIYDARFFTGDYDDLLVYQNSPTDYLWNLEDPWFLDRIRQADIIVCTGQGAWEEDSVRDTRKLQDAFWHKNISAWFDYWGHDVDHDWPWWRVQLPYYLNSLQMIGRI